MKKNSTQLQILTFILLACLGAWVAMLLPHFEIFGSLVVTTGIVGAIALIYTKLSEKRRTKKMISWGSAEMTKEEKLLYIGGYSILILALMFYGWYFSDVRADQNKAINILKATPFYEDWGAISSTPFIGTVEPNEKLKVLRIRYGKDFMYVKVERIGGATGWIIFSDGVVLGSE